MTFLPPPNNPKRPTPLTANPRTLPSKNHPPNPNETSKQKKKKNKVANAIWPRFVVWVRVHFEKRGHPGGLLLARQCQQLVLLELPFLPTMFSFCYVFPTFFFGLFLSLSVYLCLSVSFFVFNLIYLSVHLSLSLPLPLLPIFRVA